MVSWGCEELLPMYTDIKKSINMSSSVPLDFFKFEKYATSLMSRLSSTLPKIPQPLSFRVKIYKGI